ncbi:MAG: septation ring formation regulator EzrA [Bulleidia sp.]
MNTVFKYLSDLRVVIAIAVIAVILIVWFIVQKMKANQYRKHLEQLEIRYNTIKSIPISFKLNKAVAISRVEPETMEKVASTRDDFDKCESNLKQISQTLADAEDEILAGKLKKAKLDLADLEASVALGEKQVSSLDHFLDSILEKETAQREEVTRLKNRFRDLKATAQENQTKLSYIWPTIEQRFSDTEKMFSAFEEWMYASDFEKANGELDGIKESLVQLANMINDLPHLLDEARGVIPKQAEVLHQDYEKAKRHGIYLEHLKIENNLTVITNGLRADLDSLKNGNPEGIVEHLKEYKQRLEQMQAALKTEADNHVALKRLAKETMELYQRASQNSKYIEGKYARLSARYGLSNLEQKIQQANEELKNAAKQMPEVFEAANAGQAPASSALLDMKRLNQMLTISSDHLKEIRAAIDSTTGDEERAKKQLLKLQVIMNQMQVKIRKYKLPSISEQYEADMHRAGEYLISLDRLINANPLNMPLLNGTLKEAIDFIYKLYNNVNNVVATVIMVENTIVFGNRYRSTYADIDSELTRSELCFRNGDYTRALTIAIATIEKIHPGNYEHMIKENAKSAA